MGSIESPSRSALTKKRCIKTTNTSPSGAIFELKMHKNAFAAGDLLRAPLGELTVLPTPQFR